MTDPARPAFLTVPEGWLSGHLRRGGVLREAPGFAAGNPSTPSCSSDDELPQPHPLTPQERLERAVYPAAEGRRPGGVERRPEGVLRGGLTAKKQRRTRNGCAASSCRKKHFRQGACDFRTFPKVLKSSDLNGAGHPPGFPAHTLPPVVVNSRVYRQPAAAPPFRVRPLAFYRPHRTGKPGGSRRASAVSPGDLCREGQQAAQVPDPDKLPPPPLGRPTGPPW